MPRWPIKTEAERFWEKVNLNGPVILIRPDLGPCYLWTAGKGSSGYGVFKARRDGEFKPIGSHCWAWEAVNGTIPAGYEPDHLCHTFDSGCQGGKNDIHRACVNVRHMELVTRKENNLRSNSRSSIHAAAVMCPAGHPYDEANTYIAPKTGSRGCRTCRRIKVAEQQATARVRRGLYRQSEFTAELLGD